MMADLSQPETTMLVRTIPPASGRIIVEPQDQLAVLTNIGVDTMSVVAVLHSGELLNNVECIQVPTKSP
jgi:hypothetical protein